MSHSPVFSPVSSWVFFFLNSAHFCCCSMTSSLVRKFLLGIGSLPSAKRWARRSWRLANFLASFLGLNQRSRTYCGSWSFLLFQTNPGVKVLILWNGLCDRFSAIYNRKKDSKNRLIRAPKSMNLITNVEYKAPCKWITLRHNFEVRVKDPVRCSARDWVTISNLYSKQV